MQFPYCIVSHLATVPQLVKEVGLFLDVWGLSPGRGVHHHIQN